MNKNKHKAARRTRRRIGIRKRVIGTAERPRLSVYRSLNHMYAQVIDDSKGLVLASASSMEKDAEKGSNCEGATAVGKRVASRALETGVSKVHFDRNGKVYHGRVAAVAEAAREAGLDF